MGRPQTARPQTARPQTARPQAGRPQAARPQAGYSQAKRASANRPAARQELRLPAASRQGTPRNASRGAAPRRPKGASPLLKIAAGLLAVIILVFAGGFGFFALTIPGTFNITLNGQLQTVDRFTSVNSLIKDGKATPQAGDYIAVDGSILEAGAGEQFHATVNGEDVRFAFWPLDEGATVTIADGEDKMEEYTAEQVAIPNGGSETGWGAIHAYVYGKEGVGEERTGAESGITHTVELEAPEDSVFVKYNSNVGDAKVVALTFDDGPWPETTDEILDVLDQYGVKATFFTIGNQIANHPDTVKRAYDAGHQICTHSWDHAEGSGGGVNLTVMSAEEQVAEITKGLEAIKEVTGVEASKVFRAPGGNFSGDIVWRVSEYITHEIGWNIDTTDWKRPGAEAIANSIMSAKPGDIVLMHDGGGDRTQTVEALRTAIPYLQEQGYTFVTMDELLAYEDPASRIEG